MMDEGKLKAELQGLIETLRELKKKRSQARGRLAFDPESAGESSRTRRDLETVMLRIIEINHALEGGKQW